MMTQAQGPRPGKSTLPRAHRGDEHPVLGLAKRGQQARLRRLPLDEERAFRPTPRLATCAWSACITRLEVQRTNAPPPVMAIRSAASVASALEPPGFPGVGQIARHVDERARRVVEGDGHFEFVDDISSPGCRGASVETKNRCSSPG